MTNNYIQQMEKATTFKELKDIAENILLDKNLQYPRHILNTYASIYREEHDRLIRENIPF